MQPQGQMRVYHTKDDRQSCSGSVSEILRTSEDRVQTRQMTLRVPVMNGGDSLSATVDWAASTSRV